MSFISWACWLRNFRVRLQLAPERRSRRRRPRYRPSAEMLEDRALPSTFTVINTSDDTGTAGSLRWAINQVNADTSDSASQPDTIAFAIPTSDPGYQTDPATGGSWFTIQPLSPLPGITGSVVIDGYTQTGASANTLKGVGQLGTAAGDPSQYGDNAVLKIELDGASAGTAHGLALDANNITVEGLAINRFAADGIVVNSSGDVIQGNFLGTDVTGSLALGNGGADVFDGGAGSIGGPTPAARNIISGAADTYPAYADNSGGYGVTLFTDGAQVQGNFIGTDATGTKPLGNAISGIALYDNGNVIADNLISGNGGYGVSGETFSAQDAFQGNFIGTDVTGTRAVGNGFFGLFVGGAVAIGGDTAGAGNLISGNPGGLRIGSGVEVQGNFMGTDVTGKMALGKPSFGIYGPDGASDDTIGGTAPGAGNVICDSSFAGIALTGSGNVIEGNSIGTDRSGTMKLGNGTSGIYISGDSNTVAGNTIAFNGDNPNAAQPPAVYVDSGAGNSILGNSIHDNVDLHGNVGLGIYLNSANNANDKQAAPVLTSVLSGPGLTIITGTIASVPSATIRVEFFANAAGDPEGATFLGSKSVVTDSTGNGTFTAVLSTAVPAGQRLVTATVTDPSNNTSEFSAGVTAKDFPSLSGVVWQDFNNDGQVDFGENGIAGVTITLTGTDFLGNSVDLSEQTDADGAYVFLNLLPGCYIITETQPGGYPQGIDTVGTAGGSLVVTDQFAVCLGAGVNGLNYNFGEQPPTTGGVQKGQSAGIGFWNNKNGQALIQAFNGGTGTQLADWLAATMPNTFGANAGSNDVAGDSNAAIAALFQQDFLLKGVKLAAQVLATALSVYATNATLDSAAIAAQYGFTVSGTGLGTDTVNVGSNGDAFGVANNTTMTIIDLLTATDAQAVDGVLYGGSATKRTEANNVYTAVNQGGQTT